MKRASSKNLLYGIPTRWGLLSFALFLLLVTVAATYQNNLVFIMAFLIFGLVFPIIRQTAKNLSGLEVLGIHFPPTTPGTPAEAQVTLKNPTTEPLRNLEVWIRLKGARKVTTSIAPGAIEVVRIPFTSPSQRGIYACPRVQIVTKNPFGVLSVWIQKRFDSEIYVGPSPDGKQSFPLPDSISGTEYSTHRMFTPGDSLGRVDWKVLARGKGLLVREFSSSPEADLHFDLAQVVSENLETRLAQIALWIQQAHQLDLAYSLRLGDLKLHLGRGDQHERAATVLLAKYQSKSQELRNPSNQRFKFFKSLFWNDTEPEISLGMRTALTTLSAIAAMPLVAEATGAAKGSVLFYAVVPLILSIPQIRNVLLRRYGLEKYLSSLLAGLGLLITGHAFHWTPSTESAAILLSLMVLSKGLELRRFGDGIVHLLGINLTLMCTLLFEQDIPRTALMVGGVIWSFLLLKDLNTDRNLHFPEASPLRRLFQWDLILSVPALVVLFLFFPRFISPFSKWIEDRQGVQVGFSDLMDLSEMARLARSQEIAFRVEFENKTPPSNQTLYWRGSVLDSSDGLKWNPISYAKETEVTQIEVPTTNNSIKYQMILEPRFGKRLFALETSQKLSLPSAPTNSMNVQRLVHGQHGMKFPTSTSIRLEGQSITTGLLKHVGPPPQATKIPVSAQVSALAKRWRAQTKNNQEIVQLGLDFFSKNDFVYSPEAAALTSIDDFLFKTRKGFCEHFAATYSVLMREAGIPARVIAGFYGGEWNSLGNHLAIRDLHAHAWAEVWLADQGWVRVDPTSRVTSAQGYFLALNQDGQSQSRFGLLAAFLSLQRGWESLDFAYQSFLLRFDSTEQAGFIGALGLGNIRKHLWFWILGAFGLLFGVSTLWSAGRFQRKNWREKRWRKLNALALQLGQPYVPGEGLLTWKLRLKQETKAPLAPKQREWIQLFDEYVLKSYQ